MRQSMNIVLVQYIIWESLSLAIEHLHAYYVEMPGIPVTIPPFDWLVRIVYFFGLHARKRAFVCIHVHV